MGRKNAETAAENIKVLIRCRPLSNKEKDNGHKNCVELDLTAHTVSVRSLCGEPDRWTFDAVINNTFSQKDIFTQFIMPLVDSVLNGFNATVFAYGQSGSGKTHTMTGVLEDENLEGVIPRSVKHIFSSIKDAQAHVNTKSYSMYVSFAEIYNGKVRDLLSKQQITLDVRENKDRTFYVQGLNIPQVKFPEDVIRLMDEGTERRRTGSTELNADSSRSHSIFTLILACTETLEDGLTTSVTSKFNLVDLAGSERQGKTGATGDTLKEGCNINLSLSALGTVIDTIVKGGAHIPFRSSPLTMLLKDSLGGNSKTVMFANINPSERNLSETVSTLRFADRAKQIKNKPEVNMDTKDQKIAELSQIVSELRERLKKYETHGTLGLEEELERLQERVGELNIELENVKNGREADDMDFRNAQTKLEAERQEYEAKIAQMEEQIAQLQNELIISETSLKGEQSQREEIFQLCSKYLLHHSKDEENGIEKISNTKELVSVLRKNSSRGSASPKIAKLNTEIEILTVANASLKKELESLQGELEARIQQNKGAQWEKLEKAAIPATWSTPSNIAVNNSVTISEEDRKSLIAAVEEVQQQIENCALLQQIDQQLRTLSKLMESSTNEANPSKRPSSAKHREGDSTQKHLLTLVDDLNNRSETHLKIIRALYELLTVMRAGWRKAHIVPMAMLLKGNREVARTAIHEMEENDAKTAETHARVVRRLTDEISKACAGRNALLERVAGSKKGLPEGDLHAELRAILAENQELLAKYGALESANAQVLAAAPTSSPPSLAVRRAVPPPLRPHSRRSRTSPPGGAGEGAARGPALSLPLSLSLPLPLPSPSDVVELSELCAELTAQRARAAALEEARDGLYRELTAQRRASAAAAERVAELQGRLRELDCDYRQRLAETDEAARLAARLEERNAEVDQLRSVLDIQKGIILRNNKKLDALGTELKNAQAVAAKANEEHRRLCEEKDANIQHLINERVSAYMEDRIKEDKVRNKSLKKVKQKMHKLQEWVTELEGMYDKKMCECEELRQVLGEQKFEQLKLVRQLNSEVDDIEIHGHRDQIQNTLERVKEVHRRRVDLFTLGELPNAKTTASQGGFCSSSSD